MPYAFYSGKTLALIVVAGYTADLLLGDPEFFPHPVRWMGRIIAFLDGRLRHLSGSAVVKRALGALTAIVVVLAAYATTAFVIYAAYRVSFTLAFVVGVYLSWTVFASRSLDKEASEVLLALETKGIEAAREKLGRIVGRDTDKLGKDGVIRAVVETVSENTSDGVVAPLFYLAIGGPPLAIAYKAVNTLDSMLGYKNDKYRDFGWFSARLDDVANYIPARLTALFMIVAAFVLRLDWQGAVRILRRDGRAHPSPNSGLPEAVTAGAIGIRLGGPSAYGKVVCDKPYIGEARILPDGSAIILALRMMYLGGGAFAVFLAIALALI